ncbi:protein THEMIS [Discoglossus pictus]
MTTTFEKYIDSLDPKTLPRVLKIQAGIYHEGPIYEHFGSECSLSTDEVIKIVGFKVKKVLANIYSSDDHEKVLDTVELPPDFPGLFKIVAERKPYFSIDEITRELNTRPTQFGYSQFCSPVDINVENFTIRKDEQIIMKSVKEVNGIMSASCQVMRGAQYHSLLLPLSYEGEFYECQDNRMYTMKEILDYKVSSSQFKIVVFSDIMDTWDITKIYPESFRGGMILKPIYEVQAVLQFRKDSIYLSSNLDMEVMDITQHFDMHTFIHTLSMLEVFERTVNEFPMIAEIFDSPVGHETLMPGLKIIIHRKYQADRVIASELRSYKSKKHFLIPSCYKGKFKRKSRIFPTVYDLKIAKKETEELHVVVTKAFHSTLKEFSSLCVGDQLLVQEFLSREIKYEGKINIVDAVVCTKTGDTLCTQVTIPLYVEGDFVEVVHDKRKYSLLELCKYFQLPLNVKVSVRDLFAVGEDILATTSMLQLEEQITDSYLLVSLLHYPKDIWELPVHRLNLSVKLIGSFQGETFSSPTRTNIEEINEEDYYMVRRFENQIQYPPPRPPKTPLFASMSKEPTEILPETKINSKHQEYSQNLRDLDHYCWHMYQIQFPLPQTPIYPLEALALMYTDPSDITAILHSTGREETDLHQNPSHPGIISISAKENKRRKIHKFI